MNHPVLLKGNSIGLTMVLDPEMKFEQLKAAICEKFIQAKDFFNGQTQIALKIEGRKLTSQQLEEVLGIIAEKTTLTIAYVIEDDKIMETSFKEALKKLEEKEQKEIEAFLKCEVAFIAVRAARYTVHETYGIRTPQRCHEIRCQHRHVSEDALAERERSV